MLRTEQKSAAAALQERNSIPISCRDISPTTPQLQVAQLPNSQDTFPPGQSCPIVALSLQSRSIAALRSWLPDKSGYPYDTSVTQSPTRSSEKYKWLLSA